MQQDSQAGVEATLSSLSSKVQEVKTSLSLFVSKLEKEPLSWPSALDSYSALSGQISTLTKQLKFDRSSSMQNYVFLPLHFSNDHSSDLEKITDGRLSFMHHEIVPDYLRTKLDLELEEAQQTREEEASKLNSEDVNKMISTHNELVTSISQVVKSTRDAIEDQNSRYDTHDTLPVVETKKLLRTYLYGEGLRTLSAQRRAQFLSKRGGVKFGVAPSSHPYLPKSSGAN